MVTIYIVGLILLSIAWLALLAYDHEILAFGTVAGILLLTENLGVPVFDTVFSSWGSAALYLGGYISAGFLWSVPKWFFHVKDLYKEYNVTKDNYATTVAGLPEGETLPEWKDTVSYKRWAGRLPPRAATHKKRIGAWVIHWPMSIIATMLDDWLTKVIDSIIAICRQGYDRITKLATPKNIEEEFRIK